MRTRPTADYYETGTFRGGVWALFAIGAAQVFLVAGAANAAGASSFDDFLTFDGFVAYGRVMQTRKTGVPKGSMYLYTNL